MALKEIPQSLSYQNRKESLPRKNSRSREKSSMRWHLNRLSLLPLLFKVLCSQQIQLNHLSNPEIIRPHSISENHLTIHIAVQRSQRKARLFFLMSKDLNLFQCLNSNSLRRLRSLMMCHSFYFLGGSQQLERTTMSIRRKNTFLKALRMRMNNKLSMNSTWLLENRYLRDLQN
jgi:hypothetical protein